jgi:hypothetical protein
MKKYLLTFVLFVTFFAISCSSSTTSTHDDLYLPELADSLGNDFIRLSFNVGEYDENYVDAYFGPEYLKEEALAMDLTLVQINEFADSLLTLLDVNMSEYDKLEKLDRMRIDNLRKFISSLSARALFLNGEIFPFDTETELYYDMVAPDLPLSYYDDVLKELDDAVPGTGTLTSRYDEWSSQFSIPADKVAECFDHVLSESRRRTKDFVEMPAHESVTVEYVSGKPWGGYNWYQGNAHSLIQINSSGSMNVSRLIQLATHECYPGHHLFYTLLDEVYYKERGWVEYSLIPLFSHTAFWAEGTANYAADVVFPGQDMVDLLHDVFEMAGIDTTLAVKYIDINNIRKKIDFLDNFCAKAYLDGTMSKEEIAMIYAKYYLSSISAGFGLLSFIDIYRSYIINYNLGEQAIRDHIDPDNTLSKQERWERFEEAMLNILPPSMVFGDK